MGSDIMVGLSLVTPTRKSLGKVVVLSSFGSEVVLIFAGLPFPVPFSGKNVIVALALLSSEFLFPFLLFLVPSVYQDCYKFTR